MRWKTRYSKKQEWQRKRYEWHEWFAWRPVVIKDEWVWFETIYRRYARTNRFAAEFGGQFETIEYSDAMDMLRREQIRKNYDGLE